MLGANGNAQQIYELTFILWTLSLGCEEKNLALFLSAGITLHEIILLFIPLSLTLSIILFFYPLSSCILYLIIFINILKYFTLVLSSSSHLYFYYNLNVTGAIRCLYDLISAAPTRKVLNMAIHPLSFVPLYRPHQMNVQNNSGGPPLLLSLIPDNSPPSLSPSLPSLPYIHTSPPSITFSLPPSSLTHSLTHSPPFNFLPSLPISLTHSLPPSLSPPPPAYRWCACLWLPLESWLPQRMMTSSQKCSLPD